jgi:hypothetical protein
MNRNSVLSYIAAVLFLIAAILSFVNRESFRAVLGCIGALSFLLAGIHWGRKGRT